MGALSNAVSLMRDADLLELVKAASVYQSRLVVTEPASTADHAVRLAMAMTCVADPNRHALQFTNVIACDPDVAAAADTAAEITEATLISKIAAVWTPMAKMLYPNG